MPLQNRVTPFGEIVALSGRGHMVGNRGVLHDDLRRVVRYSQVKRWIACRLEFKGIRRVVMTPRRWTELFFLDEATAFSAGHRPCAECRNPDYKRFCSLWSACHGGPVSADLIDQRLHGDRLAAPRVKRVYRADLAKLPDGAFIVLDNRAWLVKDKALLAWSDTGYTDRRPRPAHRDVDVLTPRATVDVFAAGYRAATHPSAE